MDKNKFQELKAKYPKVLSKIEYIAVSDGWYNLVDNLLNLIENEINNVHKDTQHTFYAVQIKEKFASLRCYMSNSNENINEIISLAENASSKICELCGGGDSFIFNKNGVIVTNCNNCKK